MADIGIKASKYGIDATFANEHEFSFNSKNYIHAIADTQYKGDDGDFSHIVGYIPVAFLYAEDFNNDNEWGWSTINSGDGVSSTKVHLNSLANTHRYYLMFQNV